MKNLIIDTSSSNIKFVLVDNGNTVSNEYETSSQSTDIITFLLEFLKSNNSSINDLNKIGVVIGPGSYTGIRLSIAFAKGLSIGNPDIKLVPISVFDIYSNMNPNTLTMIAIDSNRGDYFTAVSKTTGEYLIEPCTMIDEQINDVMKQYSIKNKVGMDKYDITKAVVFLDKNENKEMIPLYLRPHYAEIKK